VLSGQGCEHRPGGTEDVALGNVAHDDPSNSFPMSVGTVSSFSEPNNRFVGGDNAVNLSDLLITATPMLLARLQVTGNTGLSPNAGDTFTLSLDTAGSSFQNGGPVGELLLLGLIRISGTWEFPSACSWIIPREVVNFCRMRETHHNL